MELEAYLAGIEERDFPLALRYRQAFARDEEAYKAERAAWPELHEYLDRVEAEFR
jgi:hypothetical protein